MALGGPDVEKNNTTGLSFRSLIWVATRGKPYYLLGLDASLSLFNVSYRNRENISVRRDPILVTYMQSPKKSSDYYASFAQG